MAQRGQTALFKSPLVPPHRAHRTAKAVRDFDLISPTLFDEIDHSKGLGHVIGLRILRQNNSANQNDAVTILNSEDTTVVDDTGVWCVSDVRK